APSRRGRSPGSNEIGRGRRDEVAVCPRVCLGSDLLRPAGEHPDDPGQDGAAATAAEDVADDRTEIYGAPRAAEPERSQQLTASEAAERPSDGVAGAAQPFALGGGADEVAAERAGDQLDDHG